METKLKWARSATKHRISRARIQSVVERCELRFEVSPPFGAPADTDDRVLILGDDEQGIALEIMAIELEEDCLLVIHAMPLRDRYRKQYEEAKRWQT